MNDPDNAPESRRPRRWVFWFWVVLASGTGVVELLTSQYEQANHWSRVALVVLAYLTAPVWVPLVIYSVFVSWRYPVRRWEGARRIIYFAVALLALHGLWISTQTVRAIPATHIVKTAEQFYAVHGYCPSTLKEMGIEEDFDRGQHMGHKGVSYYDGSAIYPGILPFSMNIYQCPGGPWNYFTD